MKKVVFLCVCVAIFAKNIEINVEKVIPVYKDSQNGECKVNSAEISPFKAIKNTQISNQNCKIKSKKIVVGYKNIGYLNGKEYFEISQKPLSKINVKY